MKKIILFSVTIAVIIVTSSCGGMIRSYIRKDKENTPGDFGNEKTTMLVIQHNRSYNKRLEQAFKKNYTGEYVLVEKNDLAKYADAEKYRYVFDNTVDISRGYGGAPTTSSMSFYLIDRKTNSKYTTGLSSGIYTTVLNAYVKKLETTRKNNESK